MTPKQIGIAVVERDGKYLVGIRGPDVPLAGFAEFPGGKCRPGETIFDCVIRECLEETGLQVVPQQLLQRRQFEYPHGAVDLHFVVCHPLHEADVKADHEGFYWASAEQLRSLNFPDANLDVIEQLVNQPKNP